MDLLIIQLQSGCSRSDMDVWREYVRDSLDEGFLVLPSDVNYSIERELGIKSRRNPAGRQTPETNVTIERADSAPKAEVQDETPKFKPIGGRAAKKKITHERVCAYRDKTGLGWARRISEATRGIVSADDIRTAIVEAKDIGIAKWDHIARAMDKLERELEKGK